MLSISCPACQSSMDDADSFCRRCGAATRQAKLPAKSEPDTVTLWRPQASPVVKGAAVMAAGALGQFLVRRALGTVIGGSGRRRGRSIFPIRRHDDGLEDRAQIITETVTLRRVRIRRQS